MNNDPQRVRVTVDERGVAEVAMVRADKMNAIDAAMFKGLIDAIDQLRGDRRVRVVVVHGEGRAFCAGLDMGRFREMGSGQSSGTLGDIVARTHGLANGPQQVALGLARVAGAGDRRRARRGLRRRPADRARRRHPLRAPDTQLAVMEIKWGLVPDMAGCVLLTQLARPDVVRELTFSGRTSAAPKR